MPEDIEAIKQSLEIARKDSIRSMEEIMEQHPQLDIPATESLTDGLYTREITIPKGTLLTGRVYKFDYIDLMLSGEIIVAIPSGVQHLKGYNRCDGRGGRKRAGYALEDTHWITIHQLGNLCQDKTIIEQISFYSEDEYRIWDDQMDYELVIMSSGFTKNEIEKQVTNMDDIQELDLQAFDLALNESLRHGLGLFSAKDFQPGDIICPAKIGDNRTQAGRYTNHSKTPNAIFQWTNEGMDLVALKPIGTGCELLVDYRRSLKLKHERVS